MTKKLIFINIFLICIYMFFVHLMFDFLLSFLREKGNK